MEANTIFVQIASYRDPELLPTLNDMFAHADSPENLHISICWQHGPEETTDIFLDNGFEPLGYVEDPAGYNVINMTREGATISVIDVDHHDTEGACWARYQVQRQYSKEQYTLQLDSHHRFVPDWDTLSIEMLESLRTKKCPKPLLTAYIPSFDPENDPGARVQVPWKMDFDRFIPEGAVFFRPSSIDEWKDLDTPMKSRFYSAHFCFADGTFVEEVPHDPDYFFHGEEISIAVRAFTHGYDLFHPHRIIAWHEYTRKGRTKVWDDHTTPTKDDGKIKLDWVERNNMCHRRNRILFGMDGEDPSQVEFGRFGFGTTRTVREYEEYAGISFEHRGVQQATLDRTEPANDFPYTNEDEWKASFARSNDVHVCLHKDALSEICDDFDFFYVGTHDDEGEEIYRKDLVKDEIYEYLNGANGFIDYRLIFLSTKRPTNYTIWAHSESKGWMDKITEPLNY